MRRQKNIKKRIIALSVTLAVLAAVITTVIIIVKANNDKKTVPVTPVSYVASQDYGESAYSSGMVTSDNMQSIYPDSSKMISKIFVEEGQLVKIGDPLIQYDKETLELNLDKLDLTLKTTENNITVAKRQLVKLQNTKAYVAPTPPPPEPTQPPEPTPSPIPAATATLYKELLPADAQAYAGTGTREDPYLFLCTAECKISPAFMRQILGIDAYTPDSRKPEETTTTPFAAVFEVREEDSNFGQLLSSFMLDGTIPFSPSPTPSPSPAPTPEASTEPGISTASVAGAAPNVSAARSFHAGTIAVQNLANFNGSGADSGNETNYDDQQYTSEQLKELIADKKKEIENLELSHARSKIDYERAKLALENSKVLSTVDGVVKTLVNEDEAAANGSAFLVVTGENTFYLNGTINESLLGTVNVGDIVTAIDYQTGNNYECTIISIDDYPADDTDSYYGGYSSNPNTSNYAFVATIAGAEGFGEYTYMDITFSNTPASNPNALYIAQMYVREDTGGSYVMKRGPGNRLVKLYVGTGKTLYNYYIEVKGDITMEDYIAFPYGKDVREGVRVVLEGNEDGKFPDEGDQNSSIEPFLPEGDAGVGDDLGAEKTPEDDGTLASIDPGGMLRDAPPDEKGESIPANTVEGGAFI